MLDVILPQLSTAGGPVLIALFAVSLAATATTIFKIIEFLRLGVGRHKPTHQAMAHWRTGDRAGAYHVVSHDKAQLSMVVTAAMAALGNNPNDPASARQIATQAAVQSLAVLSRNLRIIESVVQAAPMLGLLGTVIGMIEAFGKVSEGGGAADPAALAGGIWIALTTTAIGLTIAIPFYFISVWLEGRVERERGAMDAAIADVTAIR
jgi:biopolymer transport protein ExbB